jgi:hypothetical protein
MSRRHVAVGTTVAPEIAHVTRDAEETAKGAVAYIESHGELRDEIL